VGSPERPITRRDKTSPRRTSSRSVYCFISWTPFISVSSAPVEKNEADVVIFDRYIYDELANLPL